MWRLQNLLFTLCVALGCVISARGVILVTGYVGGKVNVSCAYGHGYESYEKYLCKDVCGDNDVLITTSQLKNLKYSACDDKKARTFTVTISDLTSEDAGKYWCGVTRTGQDIYTEVKLKLAPDSCCDTVTKIQSYEGYSEDIICSYEPRYQNYLKYICRGNRSSTCLQQALITSDNKQNGRIKFNDDKGSGKFTMTITSLTQSDSGTYLCGVQKNSVWDVFSAVELNVKEWCCVNPNTASGTAGYPLTFQCPYPSQHHDNSKFLCKGDHRNNCTNVTSQSRFTVQDDGFSHFFLVMITELETADAGTYWCGSDSQWRVENYTKVELSVEAVHYAVYTVVPVVLLICVLVIIYKYKCYNVRETEAVMNRNPPKAEDVIDAEEGGIYGNQEFAVTFKQQSALNHFNDPGGDEPDYKNFTTEEFYCNENYHKANKR
ncbi:polymeric immunoglobulin receptor [Oreochromis niloticus]|uniref:polymeric immunoglobulin receptor n=1 Tax=Oreochromis niloticus TaxID=8128 RepID=UPI000DF37106|nr:polymeric immunoglobulin receptor-like [Oreochromis niloticus]